MKLRYFITPLAGIICALSLNSCIVQQIADKFSRIEYPGERPPHVIKDNNGKPASEKWAKINPYDLPPSGVTANGTIDYAEDGLPYGKASEYSNIITSPYDPHYQLDYTNCEVGEKVWDPYTRKPFYIPRMYTFN